MDTTPSPPPPLAALHIETSHDNPIDTRTTSVQVQPPNAHAHTRSTTSVDKSPMDDWDDSNPLRRPGGTNDGLGGSTAYDSGVRRPHQATTTSHLRRGSAIDWVVPVEEKPIRQPTIGEHLLPTLNHARSERTKFQMKAKFTGLALNAAIGLQVLIGSLITGLSAVTTGRQTSIMTSVLGGLSTIVASYLARARGSNEPELSIARTKDLDQFIRDCEAFQLDFGHLAVSEDGSARVGKFRERFEDLLGNGNAERRMATPV